VADGLTRRRIAGSLLLIDRAPYRSRLQTRSSTAKPEMVRRVLRLLAAESDEP